MNPYIRTLSPAQVAHYVKRNIYLGRKLIITGEEKQYDLLDACYFNPLLLFRFYDAENEKNTTLSLDFGDDSYDKTDIFMIDNQIQIAQYMFIPFTGTNHVISTWTIARADGKAISI